MFYVYYIRRIKDDSGKVKTIVLYRRSKYGTEQIMLGDEGWSPSRNVHNDIISGEATKYLVKITTHEAERLLKLWELEEK